MKKLCFGAVFSLISMSIFSLIPDNSPVRRELLPFLQSPVSHIVGTVDGDAQIIQGRFSPNPVSFTVESWGEKLYLIFKNEREGQYPIVGSGNFIIRRSLESGEIEQLKMYLDDIGALVIRIVPSGRRSLMSLSLFGDVLYENLPLAPGVERIMLMNVIDIVKLAAGRIPWDRLFPPEDTSPYHALEQIITTLRATLPHLPDAEDGAMDSRGRLVAIETLGLPSLPGFNCSGFAKFVSDGVYSQFNGSYMEIENLKIKHLDLRGNEVSAMYEDSRDPYFGLDWTRNIATEIASSQQGGQVHPESSDLREKEFYSYQEDMGYPIHSITQLLYLQSIENPGLFYLGSINGDFGSEPSLWQHYHVLVLYPYFDEEGRFNIVVMERNVETSVEILKRRYPDQFIHLVKIRPEKEFSLPALFP